MTLKPLVNSKYLVLTLLVTGCTSLPNNTNKINTVALPININKPTGKLQQHIIPETLKHNNIGKSGINMLYDGQDSFIARLEIIEKAELSIDAQYYIWHDDISGRILLKSLLKAANRGVRVRLLLDDNSTKGMDKLLLQINSHPNIEVRLFNPFTQRKYRTLGYVTDTRRINRRMHNKSLTVDGVISIIGGRNIGDEYFEATDQLLFADLDVSLIGDVVLKIQKDFDRYWANVSSYPIQSIVRSELSQTPVEIMQNKKQSKDYLFSLFGKTTGQQKAEISTHQSIWAHTQFYSDSPNKVLLRNNKKAYADSVISKVMPTVINSNKQLVIMSPYFVPTQKGTKILTDMAKNGKQITIITNSLSATDVAIVHAGYSKYRKQLLKSGIDIYEFKANTNAPERNTKNKSLNGIMPDSNASLHAKVFTSDDRYLFVGSPNVDPRSANLNTELGVIIDNQKLVREFKDILFFNKDNHSYRVLINESGDLQWTTLDDTGNYITYSSEPEVGFKDKKISLLLSLLPIEGWL